MQRISIVAVDATVGWGSNIASVCAWNCHG
jgi:hypothetical protein